METPEHNPGEPEFGDHADDAAHNPGEPQFGEETESTDPEEPNDEELGGAA